MPAANSAASSSRAFEGIGLIDLIYAMEATGNALQREMKRPPLPATRRGRFGPHPQV